MQNFEVIYSKGHLVDVKTGKRVFLKRGGKFSLLGDDNQFVVKDDLFSDSEPLSSEAKGFELKNRYPDYKLKKIVEAGHMLVYRIGLSKKTSEDKYQDFWFNAYVLEDAYVRSKDGHEWGLCDCLCVTEECLLGDVQMIEAIKGYSLNNLFSNMVAFYFPFQRSGSCNAFTTYYLGDSTSISSFGINKGSMTSLENLRQIIQQESLQDHQGNIKQ